MTWSPGDTVGDIAPVGTENGRTNPNGRNRASRITNVMSNPKASFRKLFPLERSTAGSDGGWFELMG